MNLIHRFATSLLLIALALGAVPSPATAEEAQKAAENEKATAKVNLNTATATELALLPRVGPAVAQRILEFREQEGEFDNLEDLMLVRGIGEKTFALLEPYITLSGETTLTEKVRVSSLNREEGSE